jgi:hypothetical protein
MTVITLNLLAEEQQAQEARARDPVKLFTVIGLAVLTAAVTWGGTLSAVLMEKRSELHALESKWDKMNKVGPEEADFQKAMTFAQQIVTANRSRLLMSPQLALVKDLIPSSIQVSRIGFTSTTEASGADGGGGKRKGVQKGPERLVLRIEGVASSSQPELEVDQFLKSLRSDARFSVAVEDIQLRTIARTSTETDKTGHLPAAASFIIDCWYKEKATK